LHLHVVADFLGDDDYEEYRGREGARGSFGAAEKARYQPQW